MGQSTFDLKATDSIMDQFSIFVDYPQLADSARTVFFRPGEVPSPTITALERLESFRAAGVGGLTFDNYGLMTEEHLGNIGQVERSIQKGRGTKT